MPLRFGRTVLWSIATGVWAIMLLCWIASRHPGLLDDGSEGIEPFIPQSANAVVTGTPGQSIDSESALDEDEVTLASGLMATYRSLAADGSGGELMRIDSKPAFTFGDVSPHPRLPTGPFTVTWTGVLLVRETGPIRFHAFLGGELRIVLGGAVVLDGRGESDSAWVDGDGSFARTPGAYRIEIQFRSAPEVPARVQVWWEGASFAREPLPAWRLKHIPSELPASFHRESLAERGREAVERFGCGRCHRDAFPSNSESLPGPSLAGAGERIDRGWLLAWLGDPPRLRADAHMPALFAPDRTGLVERWIVADYVLKSTGNGAAVDHSTTRDHRPGKQAFIGLGCVACHPVPDAEFSDQPELDRSRLTGLSDRFTEERLADFLTNPQSRYRDGRMPSMPISPQVARDLASYLLRVSATSPREIDADAAPTQQEITTVAKRLNVEDVSDLGRILFEAKGCGRCHEGAGDVHTASVPIPWRSHDVAAGSEVVPSGDETDSAASSETRGCLSNDAIPRVEMDAETRRAIIAYMAVAPLEKHNSPFDARQRRLTRAGCTRCHQRDGDGPSPLEAVSRSLWTPFLYRLPYQRTPRLCNACGKYQFDYLTAAIRDGVSGQRPNWYSYRMPEYGGAAEELVRALAESDGDLPGAPESQPSEAADPTLQSAGPALAGFEGYACVSCHVWKGQNLAEADPGSVGPELTSVTRRVRRDWFDHWLENTQRVHPGTPMPSIFRRNEPAPLRSILSGDARSQRDALWTYFDRGKDAPSPARKPPIRIVAAHDSTPIVAQIPVQVPGESFVEAICALFPTHDLFVFDVSTLSLHSGYTGACLLRHAGGLGRTYSLTGNKILTRVSDVASVRIRASDHFEEPHDKRFLGYDRLADGVRLRYRLNFDAGSLKVSETLRLAPGGQRRLFREFLFDEFAAGAVVEIRTPWINQTPLQNVASQNQDRLSVTVEAPGANPGSAAGDGYFVTQFELGQESANVPHCLIYELPPAAVPPETESRVASTSPVATSEDLAFSEGSLQRPGYRAIRYELPQTESGESRIMPGAIAVDPHSGRVFIASLKLGELFALDESAVSNARFVDYTHGFFQDALSMTHDGDALYVLHRRNLTRISDSDGDGVADQFDRIATFPHAVANMYDWGYGLVREPSGAFVLSFAPHANQQLPGAGSVLRLDCSESGQKQEELAFGLRNPLGWTAGPEGAVFFTDNQGEWVAANKLCHVQPGRFFGYPNPARPEFARNPMARTAVWLPYGWAKSINGVAYNTTGEKFGPFAGQFFMAELMYGGAIIRANVEQVNGVYQGACFPFWGKGLLGPLVLAFDPNGHLFVGSITQPGWMGQPDRGGLYRIEFSGDVPFEMQSIHARPRGFRILFTRSVDAAAACAPESYRIEQYRYEYTEKYGSPELDRREVPIDRISLSADGRSVEIEATSLVPERVYSITASGVRSSDGEPLVNPTGVYTLNEIPRGE